MRTYARLISVAFLSLGLMAGCATTEEGGSSAEQAIADAKAANKRAKAVGYEWRDTGKMIKNAEKALADGNDAEAIKQANKAKKQAEDAVAQQKSENDRYMNSLSAEDRAALMGAESSMSKSSGSSGVGANSYSVVRGDNLWDISGKDSIYGNSYQWPLIYKANRNKIKDADLIYPGQVFDIDQNASSSDIDAAVRHARTRGAWSVGDVEQSDLDYLAR